MAYSTIILEKSDHIAKLTLNRPDKLNAVNIEMFDELLDALDDVNRDDDIRVFIITGAGRAFCSSVDLDIMRQPGGLQDMGIEGLRQFIRRRPQKVTLGIRNMEKPTIAMVNGVAVADGLDWVLACDLRVGCEKSRFMNAFARMALFPNTGAAWQLPRVVGVSRALEILYLGDWVEAEEAYRLGILTRLVPYEKLEEETMALARRLTEQPPITLKMIKMQVYKGLNLTLEASLELAADGEAMTFFSEDAKEAFAAFAEKRKPKFTGR